MLHKHGHWAFGVAAFLIWGVLFPASLALCLGGCKRCDAASQKYDESTGTYVELEEA